ncbi:MAG: tRNA 5-hydroxyuridine modification protein YegQ [Mariprofundaceae bacterium]|nr:tRNA 5-hydroxyuridine modification protein YegQ [Mariprofundaceae bacterium]
MSSTSPIELLAPAGTLRNMRYALAYGADAVYAGQPRYSLRVRNNDFQLENLQIGIQETHALGKHFYVASNLLPHNNKLGSYIKNMQPVIDMKPDALIMADPGLIMMVRETWPDMPIHLSVQANTMNWAAVRFWQSIGVTRIILSRELSLNEIEEIRQQCPDIELEVFVHGALCIAYSGRCLLSGYFNHRDANQGTCTNACRWDYKMSETAEDGCGDVIPIQDFKLTEQQGGDALAGHESARHPLADQVYMLAESQRPEELMPVFEDEHGTYIMNSKDLQAIEHVQRLVDIGIDSLKIEGRTKSHFYVGRVSQAYSQALRDARAGRPFDPHLNDALNALANRGYTDGFYTRKRAGASQNYETGNSVFSHQRFVGEVLRWDETRQMAEVEVKNRFSIGDELELMTPAGRERFTLTSMFAARHGEEAMEVAPGSGHRVWIPLPIVPEPAHLAMISRIIPADE